MAAITWPDITGTPPAAGIASELTALSDVPAQTLILLLVNTTGINVANFGGEDAVKTKMARILLAAHMATMFLRRGISGAVSSQSEGGVSESYANIVASPKTWDQTSYGSVLRTLVAGTPARAGLLIGTRG